MNPLFWCYDELYTEEQQKGVRCFIRTPFLYLTYLLPQSRLAKRRGMWYNTKVCARKRQNRAFDA